MKQILFGVLLLVAAATVAGCGAPTGTTNPTAAATGVPKPTNAPAATSVPVPTAISQPTLAPAPTGGPQPTVAVTSTPIPIIVTAAPTNAAAAPAPTTAPSQGSGDVPYLDDRSSAEALLTSFYNAINRKEYARAYSYWQAGAAELPPYQAFEQGYASTSAVQVGFGLITGDSGAGQSRYSVPVRITSQTTSGEQYFVGCYVLHLASPAAQATLPFRPLAIESAMVAQKDAPATAGALDQACQNMGSPVPPATESGAIDQSVYLDNTSDPVEVLRSFYNAINRREYTRAYSYWQDQSGLAPLPAFSEGYSTTESVTLATGEVQSDAGAGQLNYRVPVTIESHMNDGSSQTFAGCYTLHLGSPPIQSPPFKPLGITAASIQQVAAGENPTDVMNRNCQ